MKTLAPPPHRVVNPLTTIAAIVLAAGTAAPGQDCPLPPVAKVEATRGTLCEGVRLTWTPSAGADRYRVSRLPGGHPSSGVEVYATTWLDETAEPGVEYTYHVVPMGPACPEPPPMDGTTATGHVAPFELILAPLPHLTHAGNAVVWKASVEPSASAGATFRWFRNGTPIVDDGRFTGASTDTLTITGAKVEDTDLYSVEVRTTAGTILHETALVVKRNCPGDFNSSGSRTVQDLFEFLTSYFAGCP
ncbi:MAG: hypothetical protein ACK4WH_02200 [Phycisphaerales bacterium]